jgi:hypothetical protein
MVITNVIADDKPAVVVTHGDRLSFQRRFYVKNELAETLAIPLQQIFDIPGIASLLSSCSYYAQVTTSTPYLYFTQDLMTMKPIWLCWICCVTVSNMLSRTSL